jgi:hypothetical protein
MTVREVRGTSVPYQPLSLPDVTLPSRQEARGYMELDLPLQYIPEPF